MWSNIATIFLKQNKPFPQLGNVQLEYFFKESLFLNLVKQSYCHIKTQCMGLFSKEHLKSLLQRTSEEGQDMVFCDCDCLSATKFSPLMGIHASFFIGKEGKYWRQNHSFECLLRHKRGKEIFSYITCTGIWANILFLSCLYYFYK